MPRLPEKDVLELKEPAPGQLGFLSRLKVRAHGGKQAFAVRPENCDGCGLCVEACPENAVSLLLEDNYDAAKSKNHQ